MGASLLLLLMRVKPKLSHLTRSLCFFVLAAACKSVLDYALIESLFGMNSTPFIICRSAALLSSLLLISLAPAEEAPKEIMKWLQRSNGVHSLHEAVRSGDLQAVQAALDAGANVNRQNEEGDTPLHLAAVGSKQKIAEMILQAGADPTIANKKGKRPADIAKFQGIRSVCLAGENARKREINLFNTIREGDSEELSHALRSGVNPNAHNADMSDTLLTAAVRAGSLECVQALLRAGATARGLSSRGKSALHIAAVGNNEKIISALLRRGADPMEPGDNGAYPIHDAIWAGRYKNAELLIPCYKPVGYNPDGRGNGYPIEMAIRQGATALVEAFFDAGLDPNAAAFDKSPLLITAVRANRADIVRLLLKKKVNADAKDENGLSAYDYATPELAEEIRSAVK